LNFLNVLDSEWSKDNLFTMTTIDFVVIAKSTFQYTNNTVQYGEHFIADVHRTIVHNIRATLSARVIKSQMFPTTGLNLMCRIKI